MARKPRFEIAWQPATADHLRAMDRKEWPAVRDAVAGLSHEPFTETLNRKPLLKGSPFGEKAWEIRFGRQSRVRVFYRSDPEDERRVLVEAVGVKKGNRLIVGDREVTYEG